MYRSNESQSEGVYTLMGKLLEMHKEHGVVIGKDSKSNRSTYATLPGVLSQIQKMLTPYGLILTQGTDSDFDSGRIYTMLEHPESGEWRRICSRLTPKQIPLLPDYMINKMDQGQWTSYCNALLNHNSDQAWGGSTTYHRRYDAMMVCGLVSADDPTDFNEGHNDVIPENKVANTMNIMNSDVISEKQCGLLRVKLNGDKELADKILTKWQVSKLSDISWRKFNDVLAFIEESKS